MFSIIVPSYNRVDEVNELLTSLTYQTSNNFEVIVVDDCSPNTITIDRTLNYPVTLIRNEVNLGPANSRNIGAKQAKNEWLLFLDDDDRFDNKKCEILTHFIADHSELNFVYHPAKCEMKNENFSYVTKPFSPDKLTLENMLRANKIGGMPMMAIKTSFFLQLGGLTTELKSLEDYEFVLKLVSSAEFKPGYIDQPLSICTFHTQRSSVSTHFDNTEKAIKAIRQKYVKTKEQAYKFDLNEAYMLAYPYAMRLSRKSAGYYFKMFTLSKDLKYLAVALISFLSPRLAINLKRFI